MISQLIGVREGLLRYPFFTDPLSLGKAWVWVSGSDGLSYNFSLSIVYIVEQPIAHNQ